MRTDLETLPDTAAGEVLAALELRPDLLIKARMAIAKHVDLIVRKLAGA